MKVISSEWCWYCGELATGRDHIKPQSATGAVKSQTVPCCGHCNSILGDMPLYTDRERGQHIARRLLAKLKECAGPEWTDEEVSELGYNLRTVVIKTLSHRQKMERRLGYAVRHFGRVEPVKSISAAVQQSKPRPLDARQKRAGYFLEWCTDKIAPDE